MGENKENSGKKAEKWWGVGRGKRNSSSFPPPSPLYTPATQARAGLARQTVSRDLG